MRAKIRRKTKIANGLPTPIAAALGRMIVAHSILELRLSNAFYSLAGVNFKIGRVVFGNPRTADILDRMWDVAEARNVTKFLAAFPWKPFRKTLEELKKIRDAYAHGVIAYNPLSKGHVLYLMGGKRQMNNRPVSRRIYPEGTSLTVTELRVVRTEINAAIKEAEVLQRLVNWTLHVVEQAERAKKGA